MTRSESVLAEQMRSIANSTYEIVMARQAALGTCMVQAPDYQNYDEVKRAQEVSGRLLLAKSSSLEETIYTFCAVENLPYVNAVDLAVVDTRKTVYGRPEILRDDTAIQKRILDTFKHPNIGYKGDLSDCLSSPATINGKLVPPPDKNAESDIWELVRKRTLLRHEIGDFIIKLDKITWFLMNERLLADKILFNKKADKPVSPSESAFQLVQYQVNRLDKILDDGVSIEDSNHLVQGVASVYYVQAERKKTGK